MKNLGCPYREDQRGRVSIDHVSGYVEGKEKKMTNVLLVSSRPPTRRLSFNTPSTFPSSVANVIKSITKAKIK